jgi:hypothetical protein
VAIACRDDFARGVRVLRTLSFVSFHQTQPGQRRRVQAIKALRSRLLHWCLFFVPAAATPMAWNNGYPETAGLTGMAAVIGLLWFVRVWRETEQR